MGNEWEQTEYEVNCKSGDDPYSLERIVSLKFIMSLSGKRIAKLCLLTGSRLYLLRHIMGLMERLKRRMGKTEGREGIDRRNGQIGRSVERGE